MSGNTTTRITDEGQCLFYAAQGNLAHRIHRPTPQDAEQIASIRKAVADNGLDEVVTYNEGEKAYHIIYAPRLWAVGKGCFFNELPREASSADGIVVSSGEIVLFDIDVPPANPLNAGDFGFFGFMMLAGAGVGGVAGFLAAKSPLGAIVGALAGLSAGAIAGITAIGHKTSETDEQAIKAIFEESPKTL